MAQLYRKALLDRLSSPEQLDKMIVITPPSYWIAMVGAGLIVVVALIWSIFGELPVKLEAGGILVPDQGAYTFASDTGGIVSSVDVKIGDYVEEGSVIATLVDADVQNELDALVDRYEKVEAVTLDSIGDIVTQDNREMINIKNQIAAAGVEKDQQNAMLAMYQEELAKIKPSVDTAKTEMETAKNDYYSYMRSTTDSDIELDYNEAQNAYSQATNLYTNYSANAESALSTYKNTLDSILKSCSSSYATAITTKEGEIAALEGKESLTEEETAQLATLKEELETLKGYKTTVDNTSNSTAPSKLNAAVKNMLSADVLSQLEQLWTQYKTAEGLMEDAKGDYDTAKSSYDSARSEYENYVNSSSSINAEKERLGNLYNDKNTAYSNLYSQQMQYEQQITSIEGQLLAATISGTVQVENYEQQFTATRDALLYNLQSEIDKYEYNLEKYKIKAPTSGVISDIKVNAGSALGQGNEVATIRQMSEENLIVCYIPINSGKKVEEGMTVIVTPTTVNGQEYGHMEAEVVAVDDYVATSTSMRAILGDDTLVQAFTQNGPVVGVTCRLKTDETSLNGYWWSNEKGKDLMLPDGTMVTADIITDRKKPISMLIPYLKDKLSMAVEPEANNGGEN